MKYWLGPAGAREWGGALRTAGIDDALPPGDPLRLERLIGEIHFEPLFGFAERRDPLRLEHLIRQELVLRLPGRPVARAVRMDDRLDGERGRRTTAGGEDPPINRRA